MSKKVKFSKDAIIELLKEASLLRTLAVIPELLTATGPTLPGSGGLLRIIIKNIPSGPAAACAMLTTLRSINEIIV